MFLLAGTIFCQSAVFSITELLLLSVDLSLLCEQRSGSLIAYFLLHIAGGNGM
jgi:hypothetical protein